MKIRYFIEEAWKNEHKNEEGALLKLTILCNLTCLQYSIQLLHCFYSKANVFGMLFQIDESIFFTIFLAESSKYLFCLS